MQFSSYVPLMITFGYVWAGLMLATAASNLAVALWFPALWPAFLAIVPISSKLLLFAVQYLTVRAYVRPRVMAEMAAARGA